MSRLVPHSVTGWIAAVTALVSLAIILLGAEQQAAMLFGFVPARLTGEFTLAPAVPALLTPLTATLVHGGLLHLAFNLLMLLFCGVAVERIIGPGATLLLYVVGAFIAAAAQLLVDPHSLLPMVGASGAISALIGAFALSFGKARRIVATAWLNRALHVAWLAAAWAAIQWMVGFVAGQQGILIAIAAHIGGFGAGLALQRPLLLWRYRRA